LNKDSHPTNKLLYPLIYCKKKEVPFLITLVVAGIGFIASRCFAMGQRAEQPKETSIALQSKFLFCAQEDASIT
jgi:hypothetical protein